MPNKCVNKTQYPPYGGGQISDLGITWGHRPKRGKTCPGLICTIMQNFTPIGVTVADISVTGERKITQQT